MKAESLLGSIFLIFTIMLTVYSFKYDIEACFGPLLIGGVTIILLIVQLIRQLYSQKLSHQMTIRSISTLVGKTLPFLEFGGWAFILLILVYFIGITMALTLFLFIYLKRQRENWVLSILLSIGVFALVYGVFGKLLGVYLYKGFLFE